MHHLLSSLKSKLAVMCPVGAHNWILSFPWKIKHVTSSQPHPNQTSHPHLLMDAASFITINITAFIFQENNHIESPPPLAPLTVGLITIPI